MVCCFLANFSMTLADEQASQADGVAQQPQPEGELQQVLGDQQHHRQRQGVLAEGENRQRQADVFEGRHGRRLGHAVGGTERVAHETRQRAEDQHHQGVVPFGPDPRPQQEGQRLALDPVDVAPVARHQPEAEGHHEPGGALGPRVKPRRSPPRAVRGRRAERHARSDREPSRPVQGHAQRGGDFTGGDHDVVYHVQHHMIREIKIFSAAPARAPVRIRAGGALRRLGEPWWSTDQVLRPASKVPASRWVNCSVH